MLIPLFFCYGFMFAVLYIDLTFDVTARPYRFTVAPLPPDVLGPITTYYRVITRNPYVLMFILVTATTCLGWQIWHSLVPRWAGYSSMALMLVTMLVGILKIIPTAQRLAGGQDGAEQQSRMIHTMLPFHAWMMINLLLMVAVQFSTTRL